MKFWIIHNKSQFVLNDIKSDSRNVYKFSIDFRLKSLRKKCVLGMSAFMVSDM